MEKSQYEVKERLEEARKLAGVIIEKVNAALQIEDGRGCAEVVREAHQAATDAGVALWHGLGCLDPVARR